jgi:2-amino-4-hydroxy-6-hydroxymethyldihydropteridine diphosphokinase
MSEIAYLSLGSNIGDREGNLRKAIDQVGRLGRVIAISPFYETEPVEFVDQPWFVNCTIALQTDLAPEHLLAALLEIELEMGRERIQKKGPRTLDIDILLFGERRIDTAGLKIPHPAMHRRRFVLEPLGDIAPEAWHPLQRKTVHELLKELPPGKEVRRLNPETRRRS